MCGIVGYVGKENGLRILLDGIKRLEYRGYDSAGIALISAPGRLEVVRCEGKICALERKIRETPVDGPIGIAHTRWATHGRPSDENAHPHRSGPFVVVHNGIIENYAELKRDLENDGYEFTSETDTEVIVKLVEREWNGGRDYRNSVVHALKRIRGSYALVFLNEQEPDKLVAARKDSPLILGVGEGAHYLASDVPALLPYTRSVVYLEDGDLVTLSDKGFSIETFEGDRIERGLETVSWSPIMAEKAGYKHFMLKEIHEQPRAIIDTFRGSVGLGEPRVDLPELNLSTSEIRSLRKIFLIACGTSFHACLVGKHMIEGLCRIPVEVELGSEFRYRNPLMEDGSLLIVVSQSGETADTRAALQEALERRISARAIVNVVGSSLARMAHGVIHTHAGPEICVASTKAFTTQITALYLLSLYIGSNLGRVDEPALKKHLHDLAELPRKVDEILERTERISNWALQYAPSHDFLYLGRGILYPVALEGALKLKEISYIHAEGYAAGEMKHGPIALIDENMPVVVLVQRGALHEKMLSNVQEVKARRGQVLALIEEEEDERIGPSDRQFVVPSSSSWLSPVLFTIPLQLLAYDIAVLRGTDVDQPRNLAKSVTVE